MLINTVIVTLYFGSELQSVGWTALRNRRKVDIKSRGFSYCYLECANSLSTWKWVNWSLTCSRCISVWKASTNSAFSLVLVAQYKSGEREGMKLPSPTSNYDRNFWTQQLSFIYCPIMISKHAVNEYDHKMDGNVWNSIIWNRVWIEPNCRRRLTVRHWEIHSFELILKRKNPLSKIDLVSRKSFIPISSRNNSKVNSESKCRSLRWLFRIYRTLT